MCLLSEPISFYSKKVLFADPAHLSPFKRQNLVRVIFRFAAYFYRALLDKPPRLALALCGARGNNHVEHGDLARELKPGKVLGHLATREHRHKFLFRRPRGLLAMV